MATKQVFDIEVNDGAFQRFAALFQKYQEQLKQTPAAWKELSEEVNGVLDRTTEGVEDVTAATEGVATAAAGAAIAFRQTFIHVENQAAAQKKVGKEQKDTERSAKNQARYWHDMAKSTKTFAGNVHDATRSLLRWASLTGIIGGLLGGGGLFGIDRLAASAGSQRRSSMGLGVTPGEESAFNLNYGRTIDTNSFLSGTNEALNDITQRWKLLANGLTSKDLAGKDTAQVADMRLEKLKELVDRTPNSVLAQVLQAHGFGDVNLQDAERLKNTSNKEFQGYRSQYAKDAENLNLKPGDLKAWQDLQVQLDRAGIAIKNTFITGLSPLAPELEGLSKAFTKLVQDLLTNRHMKEWINDLAQGMKWLGDYMNSDQFKKDVDGFIVGVGQLGSAIRDTFLEIDAWVKWFKGTDGTSGKKDDEPPGGPLGGFHKDLHDILPKPGDKGPWWDIQPGQTPWLRQFWNYLTTPNSGGTSGYTPGSSLFLPTSYEVPSNLSGGVTPGLLDAVERQESGGRDVTSSKGAQGYFQFMPDTAARYGVNVHDEASSRAGAASYLSDLSREFSGDMTKALAAYNWGEGNVAKDIAKYGDRWRDHLPQETQNYVRNITNTVNQVAPGGQRGGNRQVQINIHNNTGGNASVSTSQLAV